MSWEQNVRRVVPYVAGEQPNKPGMIKLNTNECPYPPAPGVERLLKRMDYGALRLYPDPDTGVLVDALAEYYHVSPGQVFVGVGSDDVISMAFMTFFNGRRPILFPDVTYSFYDVWAKLHGIPYRTCPLDEDWHICPEDYRQPNGGIIFPNPNAPTGLFESLETVERIVRANRDVVVMVDEAYVDFGGRSALPLVEKYDNLLVVQTFSKSRSMAGLRIGFCIGSEKLIGYLNDVKFSFNSYTMNLPSQLLGAEAHSCRHRTPCGFKTWGRRRCGTMSISRQSRPGSWPPGSGSRGSLGPLDSPFRTRRQTSSLPPMRRFRPSRFSRPCGRRTSTCATGTSRGYPIPCASLSERRRRWTRSWLS